MTAPDEGNLESLLEDVRVKYGLLTPANVVAAARPKKSPLHSHFTWDQKENSERYLLLQAAALLRRMKIRYENPATGELHHVRAYFPMRSGAVSAYEPTEEILADPLKKQLLLRRMRREWLEFRRRWEHMEEFAAMIANESGSGAA